MSRRHRLAAETAARHGYVIERRAETNYLGHVQYALRRGRHLPAFSGSIGEIESFLNELPLRKQTAAEPRERAA